ncbi:MAG: Ig-like domain-containing protein [Candidatus Limivivens sp.]|nr:Ig-like domain-containing protein [Candidatus Limivivens sp.]
MNKWNRICHVLAAVIMMALIFAFPVSAETVSGDASGSTTFYVTTDSRLLSSKKVTLTQKGKGKAIGIKLFGGAKKYYSMYGRYRVTVSYSSGGKLYRKTYDWTGKTKTFSLGKNRKYKFVVQPYSKTELHTSFQALVSGCGFYGWDTVPVWNAAGGSGAVVSYSDYTPQQTVQPSKTTQQPSKTTTTPHVSVSAAGSTGGSSLVLKATVYPANAAVTWSSSNTKVATVSAGKVSAKGVGTAVITAKMKYQGRTYSAKRTIKVTSGTRYGSWSAWSLSPVSATSSREVRTTKLFRYYSFTCPVCGGREPYQGLSDCHRYSLTLANAEVGWFPVSYASCKPQRYSYTKNKYYTTSLGDGRVWNFSAGNLHSSSIGTKDSDSAATVIEKGYSYRSIYKNSFQIVSCS